MMVGIVIPPPGQPGGEGVSGIGGVVLAVLALALIIVPLLVFWLRDRSSSRGAPAEQDEREAMPKAA